MQHLTETICLALGLGLVQALALNVTLEDLRLLQLPAGHFVLGDGLATLLSRISAGAIESHAMSPWCFSHRRTPLGRLHLQIDLQANGIE